MSITKADITGRMRIAMHRPPALRQPGKPNPAEEHGPNARTKRALKAKTKEFFVDDDGAAWPIKNKPRRATSMNKTETEYLERLKRIHEGSDIRWEAYTLRLANRCNYTPDFSVQHPGKAIDFHEVKGGYIFPKALVKLRMAAELFTHRFFLAQKKGGKWTVTEMQKR